MDIHLGVGLFWKDMVFEEYKNLASQCEQLGYDQLWITNEKFYRDMYVSASVAAMATQRPSIGTFVSDPYTVHPALTTLAIGTLDEVSGGRGILCYGAGGTGFPSLGIVRTKPAKAIKEAVLLTRQLLSGENVDFNGEVIKFKNSHLNFQPRKNIPIYVASRGDMVLQTAGEVADGAMIATYAEPVGIRHALSQISQGADRTSRSINEITLISRVDACIHEDRRVAIEAVKKFVGVFLWTSYPDKTFVHNVGLEIPNELEKIIALRDYNLMEKNSNLIPDSFVDKFCWAGSPEDVAEKITKVIDLGITNITFLPHAPAGGNILETIQAFAKKVKPMVEAYHK